MNDSPTFSPCPEPAALAAFVEGLLGTERRALVTAHLATCPECLEVAGATACFLTEGVKEQRQRQPGNRWLQTAAAAAAAMLLAGLGWHAVVGRDPLRRLRALAAESGVRRIEAHLEGFAYRRLAFTRSEPAAASLAYRAEAERLSAGPGGGDGVALHARGVAVLLNGESVEAVRLLTASTRLDQRDHAAWNDLAAARIAVLSYDDALAAADRAIAIDPDAAAAYFNRGLALDRLGRRLDAAAAYRAALDREPDVGWQREVRDRLARLTR